MVSKPFPQPSDAASLAQQHATARDAITNHNPSTLDSNTVDEALLTPQQTRANAFKSWSFPLIALLACTMTGGTAAIAFLSLTALPPETDCTQSANIDTDRGLLYCVQRAAQSGEMDKVLEGLEILGQWTTTDPLYYEAQASLEKWSRTVLISARQKLRNNELDEAIALVKKVPQSSPLHDEAQEMLSSWQNQADQAHAIVTVAQDALKQKDWDQVSKQINNLGDLTAYAGRSNSIRKLSSQLRLEKENNAIFQSVLQMAAAGTPQEIGPALEKASTIDQSTYVWAEAQSALKPVAEQLLSYGSLQWQQGHLANAITTAQRVAIFDNLAPEARHLETLSRARQLAIATDTNWIPSHAHLFNLLEATSAVRQIPSSSQFYAQAQDSLKSWEAQFADVSHLQVAQMSAQLGWAPTVEWASNQAEQLSPDRPRRVQAQTLAAHWSLELERIKDRRHLIWASKLSEPRTRASLKMAIAEAEKVQRDRPLFGEAQGLIYSWTRDIQKQEDQPYLTLAESLARQGELREAIKTAAFIKPNRPLHNRARTAIKQWQQEIWAQQRAEQQRAARSRPRRRVVQPVVTTVAKPQARSTPAPVRSSAVTTNRTNRGPAPLSAPRKTPNSPVPQQESVQTTPPTSATSQQPSSQPANPANPPSANIVTPVSAPAIINTQPQTTTQPIRQPRVEQPINSQIGNTPSLPPRTTPPALVPPGEPTNTIVPEPTPSNPSVPAPAPIPVTAPTPVPAVVAPSPAPASVVTPPPAPAPVVAPAPVPAPAAAPTPVPTTTVPNSSPPAASTPVSLNSGGESNGGSGSSTGE